MNQIAIIPSGCQINHHVSILYFDSRYIIYVSTLAVYVLNAKTFLIEKVLSFNHRAITSISVSPHDKNMLVVGSIDGSVCLWNIDQEIVVNRVLFECSVFVAWDPSLPNHIAVITLDGAPKFCYWDSSVQNGGVNQLVVLKNAAFRFTTARWNPNCRGELAIGCNNGAVFIFKSTTTQNDKNQKILRVNERNDNVVDIQWDRLSSIYILIAYSYFISLWDTDSSTEIHIFEKQPIAITAIAWLDWTAGNFVSSNNKNSGLKVWNSSQKQPLEVIKVSGDCGINSLFFNPGSKRLLCSNIEGSIQVYNLQKKQLEYISSAGHTETIFDCKLSPHSPDIFATCSFDTTIKVWSLVDSSLQKTLYGSSEIVYCIDWSPKGDMIVGSNSFGNVIIWNVETGREVVRFAHHKKASYCVVWNKFDENCICSTSADCNLVLFYINTGELLNSSSNNPLGSRKKNTSVEGDIKFRFLHPAAVYGCAFCESDLSIIASCCHDGNVRIFDYLLKRQLIYVLEGHKMRAFHCCWSSLKEGYLASGSDDLTINIWVVNLNISSATNANSNSAPVTLTPKQILSGHKSNVRALTWNTEHRNLLLSGSWDSSIRLWDVSTGTCLFISNDHVADVYSIVAHPSRPFTYISCSRDTTIRVWEISGVVTRMRFNSFWDCNFNNVINRKKIDLFDSVEDATVSLSESLTGFSTKASDNKSIYLLPPLLYGKVSSKENNFLFDSSESYEIEKNVAIDSDSGKDNDSSVENDGSIKGPIKFKRVIPDDRLKLAKHFYRISAFFCGTNGSMELWENILCLLYPTNSTSKMLPQSELLRPLGHRLILNESELILKAKSEARKLESSKIGHRKNEMSSKIEDQMRSAALMHARTGDFARYCQIMIDIGDYNSALALAPSVSLEYWQELSLQFSQHLINNHSEQCVPYLLGNGKDADAIEFYLLRNDPLNAMIVAKMSENREDLVPSRSVSLFHTTERERNQNDIDKLSPNMKSNMNSSLNVSSSKNSLFKNRDRSEQEVEESRKIVKLVSRNISHNYYYAAKPILAAAYFISVNDVASALMVLSNNYEYDMAYATALCFGIDTTPFLVDMADRCACLNAIELALDILDTLSNREIEIGLLLSRYCTETKSRKFLSSRSFQTSEYWLDRGKEEEVIGSDAEAVISYVIARHFTKAAVVGLEVLKHLVRQPTELSSKNKLLIRGLKYVRAVDLDDQLRVQFFQFLLWFSAHEAAIMGMFETAANMIFVLVEAMEGGEENIKIFPLKLSEVKQTYLIFLILAGDRRTVTVIDNVIDSMSNSSSSELLECLKRLEQLLLSAVNSNEQRFMIKTLQAYEGSENWGSSSAAITMETDRLILLLNLSNLSSISASSKSSKSKDIKFAETNKYQSIDQSSILQGSILPASNQQLKSFVSYLSGKKIQGCSVQLNENLYISINEAANWRRIIPYSPILNGDLIYF